VWMGPGAAMHPRGTYSAMAVHALNGLVGSVDAEGGVWQSSSVPTGKFANAQISKLLKAKKSFRLQEDKGTRPNVHYVGKYTMRA